MNDVTLRSATELDTARLVEIWRAAVQATHSFLSPSGIDVYAHRLAVEFFPSVELTAAECTGEVRGFSGIAGSRLEMLFVHPDTHGRGVGSALLAVAVAEGVDELDVNEQTPDAVGFYGDTSSSRSAVLRSTRTGAPSQSCVFGAVRKRRVS